MLTAIGDTMMIAIASGKGGTGKTTVATSLAYAAPAGTCLLDCDVEEPNAHIFCKPQITSTEAVTVPVPRVDPELCDACGACGEICQFSAIVTLKAQPLTFPELCHSCGGCASVCPHQAIKETGHRIGVIERGQAGTIEFVRGCLDIGRVMSAPLINAVKKYALPDRLTIIDAPPGTSCPVIAAVKGCQYVVLVTEPTPFGMNDLLLAVAMVRELHIPFGVLVNRADLGDDRLDLYCAAERIPILLKIPHDQRIAQAYSRGQAITQTLPQYRKVFAQLAQRIQQETAQ